MHSLQTEESEESDLVTSWMSSCSGINTTEFFMS